MNLRLIWILFIFEHRWGDTLNLKGSAAAFVTVTKANGNGKAESQQMRIEEAEVRMWNHSTTGH